MLPLLFLFISLWKPTEAKVQTGEISFNALLNDAHLELGKSAPIGKTGDSVSISTLKFYVMDITLYKGNKKVGKATDRFHLIDLSDPSTLNVPFTYRGDISQISFTLGIDSAISASGPGAGDLDPVKGMYWTWQSGYINAKIEGLRSDCGQRNSFQYHLGGYESPNETTIDVYRMIDSENRINICLNINSFINATSCSTSSNVQEPGVEAHRIATLLSACFVVTP